MQETGQTLGGHGVVSDPGSLGYNALGDSVFSQRRDSLWGSGFSTTTFLRDTLLYQPAVGRLSSRERVVGPAALSVYRYDAAGNNHYEIRAADGFLNGLHYERVSLYGSDGRLLQVDQRLNGPAGYDRRIVEEYRYVKFRPKGTTGFRPIGSHVRHLRCVFLPRCS